MKKSNAIQRGLVGMALGLAAMSSHAICALGPPQVTDNVLQVAASLYTYSYEVIGERSLGSCAPMSSVTTFSLPYFTDAGITAVASPSGWSYAISATDTFGLGAQTITWTTTGAGILPGQNIIVDSWVVGETAPEHLVGFGYQSLYAAAKGPFLTADAKGRSFVGDPAVPGSPMALAAGLQPITAAVPEPSTYALLAAGLGMILFASRRRRNI